MLQRRVQLGYISQQEETRHLSRTSFKTVGEDNADHIGRIITAVYSLQAAGVSSQQRPLVVPVNIL